jgi:hypothetical protein
MATSKRLSRGYPQARGILKLPVALMLLVTPALAQDNQGDRPMWDIAPAWSCHFVQEFRCSSDEKNCAIGPQEYNRDLSLDFGREAISYVGAAPLRLQTGNTFHP